MSGKNKVLEADKQGKGKVVPEFNVPLPPVSNIYEDAIEKGNLGEVVEEVQNQVDAKNKADEKKAAEKAQEMIANNPTLAGEPSPESPTGRIFEKTQKEYDAAHPKEPEVKVPTEENYIENSNEAVANAKVGDKLKRDNGEVVTITQEDIDAAKKAVGNKVPEPEVKVPTPDGEVPTQQDVVEVKKTHLEEIDDKIAEAEAAVAAATGEEKRRLESHLKDLKEARDIYASAENFNMEDAEKMYKDMDYLESDVYKHELPKGLFGSWSADLKKARQGTEKERASLKEAEDLWKQDKKDFEKAKKAYEKAINGKASPEEVAKLKEAYEDAKAEWEAADKDHDKRLSRLEEIDGLDDEVNAGYGWFLMNALGTALSNMYIPGAYGKQQGTQKSAWQQRQESNISRETERWNKAKDKKFEDTRNVLETKFGKESAIIDAYNKLLSDSATQRTMNRLSEEKIIQAAYVAEDLGKILKDMSIGDIFRASLYGTEDPILKAVSTLGSDELDQVIQTLENHNVSPGFVEKLKKMRSSF